MDAPQEWTLGALAAARVAIKRSLRTSGNELSVTGRQNLVDAYSMLQQIERELVTASQRRAGLVA